MGMDHLLYFVGGRNTLSAGQYGEIGLAHLAGTNPIVRQCSGPNGQSGIIFAAVVPGNDDPPDVGYYPDRQEWLNCDTFWLGHAIGASIKPKSLQRTKQFRGYPFMMNDGHEWIVPAVPALPTIYSRDNDGKLVRNGRPEHEEIKAKAQRLYEWIAVPGSSLDDEILIDTIEDALCLNYHLSKHEFRMLPPLICSDQVEDIAFAICDGPRLNRLYETAQDAIKKKESVTQDQDTSTTSSGEKV